MTEGIAWSDEATRVSFGRYVLRAGVMMAAGAAVALAAELVRRSSSTTDHERLGVTLVFVLLMGLVIVAYAALALVTSLRMRRILHHQPWRPVRSTYEHVHYARGTDLDIVHLSHGGEAWDLTLAVPLGRSERFVEATDLLVASVRTGSGVLASIDRGVISWGMNSRFSAYILAQKRRRDGSPNIWFP